MCLLGDAFEKRHNVKITQSNNKMDNYDMYKELLTPEKTLKELKDVNKELMISDKKYDYFKLPKDDI